MLFSFQLNSAYDSHFQNHPELRKLAYPVLGLPFMLEQPFHSTCQIWRLNIYSGIETFNTPLMSSRFLHLKAPLLCVMHVSVLEDPSDLRKMPENHYDKLKHVQIKNFSSAKSLVELTSHIVEFATSLESLTLDTTYGIYRCSVNKCGRRSPMGGLALREAHRGVLAAQRYIKPKVPSMVEILWSLAAGAMLFDFRLSNRYNYSLNY